MLGIVITMIFSGCDSSGAKLVAVGEGRMIRAESSTVTSKNEVVPERSHRGSTFLSDSSLYEAIQKSDGRVRIGLKAPGKSRGFWHGENLVSENEVAPAIRRLSTTALQSGSIVRDEILPAITATLTSFEALRTVLRDPSVDYVVPTTLTDRDFRPADISGCDVGDWSGPLYSGPFGGSDFYSSQYSDSFIDRAWSYSTGSFVTMGWVDTGVDLSGTWPELNAMYGRLSLLNAQTGSCSHGDRSVLVAAGPADGSGSVGVAYASNVISSSTNSSTGPLAGPNDAYAAVHQLYLPGGMPAGQRIIVLEFGLTGESSDLSDLIDYGYYNLGYAFFAPTGSSGAFLGVVFPAYKSEVFAVTARISVTEPHPLAQLGPEVDGIAFAPVFVSGNTSHPYSNLNVSSGATAEVAGIAALVMSKYPSLSNVDLYNRLRNTTRDYCGPDPQGVAKIINAEAAAGGLCVPPSQFYEQTYSFSPGGPTTATHNYCLQFSGGVRSHGRVEPASPTDPLCGSVTFGPDPDRFEAFIWIPTYVWDDFAPANPPLVNYFKIRVLNYAKACPPENPYCM